MMPQVTPEVTCNAHDRTIGPILLLAAVALFLVGMFGDLFLAASAPLDACIDAGTRKGRYVQHYLCSPHLLGMGPAGIARFALIWAPVLPLAAYGIQRLRGKL